MRTFAILLVLAVAGCGGAGGGDTGPGGPVGSFQLDQTSPPDASSNVPLTQELRLIFTKPVAQSSLNATTIVVEAETGDRVLGQLLVSQASSNTVRFLPTQGYFAFAVHNVTMKTGLQATDGQFLDREYGIAFQTVQTGPVLPTQAQVINHGQLLNHGRWFHRMTLLSNGRLLVCGGYGATGSVRDSAEEIDTGALQSTLVPSSMIQARAGHVQMLLRDGRVLLAGGETLDVPFVPLADCEIYDPATRTFSNAATMAQSRSFAHGVLLNDGRVLVTGGQGKDLMGVFIFRDDAEIYNPLTDTWATVALRMRTGRSGHFSALIPGSIDVVVIGGSQTTPASERYITQFGVWDFAFLPPFGIHHFGAATVMPDGRSFVAGGTVRNVTIYDPQFGFLQASNTLSRPRTFATATAWPDGRVVVAGGTDFANAPVIALNSIAVLHPIGSSGRIFEVPGVTLPVSTSHHEAGAAVDGSIWLTGGVPLNLADPALRQVTQLLP